MPGQAEGPDDHHALVVADELAEHLGRARAGARVGVGVGVWARVRVRVGVGAGARVGVGVGVVVGVGVRVGVRVIEKSDVPVLMSKRECVLWSFLATAASEVVFMAVG